MNRMFRVLVAVAFAVAVFSAVGLAATTGVYQARSLDDIDFARNPYSRNLPDPIRIAQSDDREDGHPGIFDNILTNRIGADGMLVRPTQITMADLEALSCFITQNDMVGLWEHIDRYGPITSIYILSEIRIVSLTRAENAYDPKPAYAFSAREVMMVSLLFDLEMGTHDSDWPVRYF